MYSRWHGIRGKGTKTEYYGAGAGWGGTQGKGTGTEYYGKGGKAAKGGKTDAYKAVDWRQHNAETPTRLKKIEQEEKKLSSGRNRANNWDMWSDWQYGGDWTHTGRQYKSDKKGKKPVVERISRPVLEVTHFAPAIPAKESSIFLRSDTDFPSLVTAGSTRRDQVSFFIRIAAS